MEPDVMRSAQVSHIKRPGVVVVVSVAGSFASVDFADTSGGVLAGEIAGCLLLRVGGVVPVPAGEDVVSVPLVLGCSDLGSLTSSAHMGTGW